MSQAPHKLLLKGKSSSSKIKCNRLWRTRNVTQIKGEFLCTICKNKRLSSRLQLSASMIKSDSNKLSLEDALAKTYIINGYLNNNGTIIAQKHFPAILIGHKIKLVLVE